MVPTRGITRRTDDLVITGAADPDVLVCGHSHLVCMLMALKLGLVPEMSRVAVAFSESGRVNPDPSYWDFVADHGKGRQLVVVWNGNQHNAGFLISPKPPLRVYHARIPAEDGDPAAVWVPQELLRAYWRPTNDDLDAVLTRLAPLARRLFVLGTPPPKPDALVARSLHTEEYFVALVRDLGLDGEDVPITSGLTRCALWWVVQDMLAESALRVGGTFIPAPAEAFDPQGFLRSELATPDATHANEMYGAFAWCALVAATGGLI